MNLRIALIANSGTESPIQTNLIYAKLANPSLSVLSQRNSDSLEGNLRLQRKSLAYSKRILNPQQHGAAHKQFPLSSRNKVHLLDPLVNIQINL